MIGLVIYGPGEAEAQDGLHAGFAAVPKLKRTKRVAQNHAVTRESIEQMTEKVWRRDEIESPCIKICVVHPETRLCTGCLRSIDEITQWSRMSHEDRREIMESLPAREALHKKRRGGRAARLKRKA